MLETKVARARQGHAKGQGGSRAKMKAPIDDQARAATVAPSAAFEGIRTTCTSGSDGAPTNCGKAKADPQVASTTTGCRPSARSPRRLGSTQREPVGQSIARAGRRAGPGRSSCRSPAPGREALAAGPGGRLPCRCPEPRDLRAQLDRCGKRPIVAAASAGAPPRRRTASRSVREPDGAKGGIPELPGFRRASAPSARKRAAASGRGGEGAATAVDRGRRRAGRGGAGGWRDRRRADRLLARSLARDLAGSVPGILLSRGGGWDVECLPAHSSHQRCAGGAVEGRMTRTTRR